jgi:hypothetical protein
MSNLEVPLRAAKAAGHWSLGHTPTFPVRFSRRRPFNGKTVVIDAQLVREFAASGAEEAFAELVRRHAGLVRAAALRQTLAQLVHAQPCRRWGPSWVLNRVSWVRFLVFLSRAGEGNGGVVIVIGHVVSSTAR